MQFFLKWVCVHMFVCVSQCPGGGSPSGTGQWDGRCSGRGHAGAVNHVSLHLWAGTAVWADRSFREGHLWQSRLGGASDTGWVCVKNEVVAFRFSFLWMSCIAAPLHATEVNGVGSWQALKMFQNNIMIVYNYATSQNLNYYSLRSKL